MRYLRSFNESTKSIESICKEYGIENYTINGDGTIDVDGDVDLMVSVDHFAPYISKTLFPIKFNKVSGDFFCEGKGLISLEGPEEVVGSFYCEDNLLTSLEGAPKEVSGSFVCDYNRLNTLEGAPKKVGGDFWCSYNYLTSLEGAPERVGGYFECNYNQLTSLEGSPKEVGGHFNCSNNKLTSVRGFPEDFEGELYIGENPVFEIIELISLNITPGSGKFSFLISKIVNLLNEYDVISLDGKKVYWDNLEEVFNIIGQEIPKDLKFKNYEIH